MSIYKHTGRYGLHDVVTNLSKNKHIGKKLLPKDYLYILLQARNNNVRRVTYWWYKLRKLRKGYKKRFVYRSRQYLLEKVLSKNCGKN
jgi:hypothetical protein